MTGPVAPRTAEGDAALAGPLPDGSGTDRSGTGDRRVDDALRRLEGVDALPLADQVPAYEAAHRTLQDALATVDGE